MKLDMEFSNFPTWKFAVAMGSGFLGMFVFWTNWHARLPTQNAENRFIRISPRVLGVSVLIGMIFLCVAFFLKDKTMIYAFRNVWIVCLALATTYDLVFSAWTQIGGAFKSKAPVDDNSIDATIIRAYDEHYLENLTIGMTRASWDLEDSTEFNAKLKALKVRTLNEVIESTYDNLPQLPCPTDKSRIYENLLNKLNSVKKPDVVKKPAKRRRLVLSNLVDEIKAAK